MADSSRLINRQTGPRNFGALVRRDLQTRVDLLPQVRI